MQLSSYSYTALKYIYIFYTDITYYVDLLLAKKKEFLKWSFRETDGFEIFCLNVQSYQHFIIMDR